ncbi:MAG TPA: Crp/Fnr family transcriptional regulator [Allosphingosinicella sp.]
MLLPLVAKLATHVPLSNADRDAILSLPHKIVVIDAGRYLFREGDRATNCNVILSGFACTHKILPDGSRQILAVHMKGDGIDLQNALMVLMEHNAQALTSVEVAVIPAQAIAEVVSSRPSVARAIWIETLIHASIQREWTVNVGRRDARTRIAHLLCELGIRQEAAGLADRDRYVLPLTQEQLADATALTAVHVNRVLQGLAGDGLITREKRSLNMQDWHRMADAGQFTPDYLQPAQNDIPSQPLVRPGRGQRRSSVGRSFT